jgi:hypothetical protein
MSDQITCVCGTEFEGSAAKLVRIRLEQFTKKMVPEENEAVPLPATNDTVTGTIP